MKYHQGRIPFHIYFRQRWLANVEERRIPETTNNRWKINMSNKDLSSDQRQILLDSLKPNFVWGLLHGFIFRPNQSMSSELCNRKEVFWELRKSNSDVSREYGLGRAQGLASWTRPCPNQNSKPWSYKIGFGTFSSSQSLQYLVSLRYSLCEWCLSLLVMVLTADNSLDNRDNCDKGDIDDEQIGELSCAVKLVLIGIMAALSIIITVRAAQK